MSNRNFAVPFHTVAWVVFLAIVATNVVASLELRGLYADGAFYLLNMIQDEGFWLNESSRRTVQFLQQLPSVMGMAYGIGIHDAGTLAVVYSLTMQLLPLAFVATCYLVLPKNRKEWFFFRCYITWRVRLVRNSAQLWKDLWQRPTSGSCCF